MIRYYIGTLLKKWGYTVIPNFKLPENKLPLVEIGWTLLRTKVQQPCIVQVGAFDGIVSDPLHLLLQKETNYTAFLIEPQPGAFEKISTYYAEKKHIVCINKAITEKNGTFPLYLPKTETVSAKASLDPDHRKKFHISEHDMKTISVEGMTVLQFKTQYGVENIDFLQIDTEGYDLKILSYFFDASYVPSIIQVESFHLSASDRKILKQKLEKNGYYFLDMEYDTYALHKSLLY